MSSVEDEILQLKSYFKHHRIITYAMLGFIVFSTLVTTVTLQSINQSTYTPSIAAEANKCSNIGDWCYSLELRDIQVGGGSGQGGACYTLARIVCKQPNARRCGAPYGCTERWNTGLPDPFGKSCAQRGSCDKIGTWEWAAWKICGCTVPTSIPPTATPTPTPTTDPRPYCGENCIIDVATGTDSCKELSKFLECIVIPCRQANCPDVTQKKGKCGGAVCTPIPTEFQTCPINCRWVSSCSDRVGCSRGETCSSLRCCCPIPTRFNNTPQSQNGNDGDYDNQYLE